MAKLICDSRFNYYPEESHLMTYRIEILAIIENKGYSKASLNDLPNASYMQTCTHKINKLKNIDIYPHIQQKALDS